MGREVSAILELSDWNWATGIGLLELATRIGLLELAVGIGN